MYQDVLVSIIIPIYNVEAYFRRCIDSVRKQTHHRLEIILIDDGSTDGCAALCDQFSREDDRIIAVHQEHCGAGAARNRGLDLARGEWLCFVDSDDFISNRFVELLLRAVMNNDCLTAQCKHKRGPESRIEESSSDPGIRTMDWRSFLFHCMAEPELSGFGFCFNICHRSLFSNLRFPDLKYSEDAAIVPPFYYAARQKQVAVVDRALYHYFLRSSSTTHKKTTLDAIDRCVANQQILSFWEEKKEFDLFDIYWRNYFQILIDEYVNLSRELPQHYSEYRHLEDEISRYTDKARNMCHSALTIPVGAHDIWNSFAASGKPFVMYGYGDLGSKALEWIRYFKLNLAEIWDRRAADGETIDNIPFCPAHAGQDKEVTILIAIGDLYLSLSVQHMLRQLGYTKFVRWTAFEASLKYAKYNKFLQFLLEDKACTNKVRGEN